MLPKGEAPGLAMGLGGVGMQAVDLVMLYTGLARLGIAPCRWSSVTAHGRRNPRRLLDPVAAWYVGNILIGAPPPDNAPPAASPSRPAPPTAIAMPGRSASTAA